MSSVPGEAANSRYLFPDAADFLTLVGRAINEDFLGGEAAVVRRLADAGNVYVNRNIIGATVGAQPFDGGGGRL